MNSTPARKTWHLWLLLCVVVLGVATLAPAQLITFHGTVSTAVGSFPTPLAIAVGDEVTLRIAFNSSAPVASFPTQRSYSGQPIELQIGVNPTLSLLPGDVTLQADYVNVLSPTQHQWGLYAGGQVGGFGTTIFGFNNLHSSTDVGVTLTNFPAGVPIGRFDIDNVGGLSTRSGSALWRFDHYTVDAPPVILPVPEPASLGSGAVLLLLALVGYRRWRVGKTE